MSGLPTRPYVGIGIILLRGDDVLLIKRGKPPGLGRWSLPGGRQELGETAEAAARRELREETGLVCGELRLAGYADAIHRDAQGRIEFHYTILDFCGLYAGGTARAGDDAADIAWARDLAGFDLTPDTLRLITAARRLWR